MNPSENKISPQQDKERADFLEREKERESRLREQRLAEHREGLREQMLLRGDYYQLSFMAKFFLVLLMITLFSFILILLLSYFDGTKTYIFDFIKLIV